MTRTKVVSACFRFFFVYNLWHLLRNLTSILNGSEPFHGYAHSLEIYDQPRIAVNPIQIFIVFDFLHQLYLNRLFGIKNKGKSSLCLKSDKGSKNMISKNNFPKLFISLLSLVSNFILFEVHFNRQEIKGIILKK